MKTKLYFIGRLLLFFVFLISFYSSSSQQIARGLTGSNGVFIGFWEYKPVEYASNPTAQYPLIIFLHGIGERGDGTSQLSYVLGQGIPRLINSGSPMRFYVDGQWQSFMVLSPQLSPSQGVWPPYYVEEMIKYAEQNLRVDRNRIYLTGLSLGGGGVWNYASSSVANASKLAAIAPVCGTCNWSNLCNINAGNVPVYAFHAADDGIVGVGCTQMAVSTIQGCSPAPATAPIMKIYPDGNHYIWDRAYDTTHNWQNPNLYEWFLSKSRNAGPPNVLPVVDAGADQIILLPTNSVNLNGTASDADGTITNYTWSRISGPGSHTIGSPNSPATSITNLVQGIYQFELRVTDNRGAVVRDNVTITVNQGSNLAPVANAGPDLVIHVPTNSVNLDGSSSSDPDGSITAYNWAKISGPVPGTIVSGGNANTVVNNLVQGTYQFRLTITDNLGTSSTDIVSIKVNAPPVALGGADQTIVLPTNGLYLMGSGSFDTDGSITTFNWAQLNGPAAATLTVVTPSNWAANNLIAGVYNFRLTVTDNDGAIGYDTFTVTVNSLIPNQPPVANAGADQTIQLPVNSANLNGGGSTDADGSISTYSWSKISGPASSNIVNASSVSTAVNTLVQGTYQFRLLVTDNAGATDDDTMVVVVNAAPPPPNVPPVAHAGADLSIQLPTNSVTLNGTGSSDQDGTITNYSWSFISGPATYNIVNPASVTTVVNNLVQGTYQFSLLVIDNNGATSSDVVVITVTSTPPPPPNVAPLANAGTDITIQLPVSSASLNGSASTDADGTITSYSWSKISGPPSYNIANGATASTAVNGLEAGTYLFRLVVTDNGGATDDDTVAILVYAAPPPPNIPPVANAGNDQTIQLPVNNVNLNGGGSGDADGAISSYSWSKISGPASYNFSNANASSTGAGNLTAGTYAFRLVVTDNNGATDDDTVVVNVNAAPPPVNIPPVANAGNDQTIQLPVNNVDLNGGASSDPDGSIVSYAWTKISGPASYNFSNPNGATNAVTSLTQGTYVFRLVVNDNSGASASDSVVVIVNAPPPPPNVAPIANAGGDQAIQLPVNNVNLNGSASSDPDGSIVSYAWTKLSGPASFNFSNPNGAINAVTNLTQGTYEFRLVVADNSGATNADTVVVTVYPAPPPPNVAPIANAGGDQSIQLPTNNANLDGSGSSDPDGNIVSYAWTKLSGPASFNFSNPNGAINAVTNLTQGTYEFRLVVTDNSGATDADTVVVTVYPAPPPANVLPIANAGSDQSIQLPINNANLDGSASSDPDGSIVAYSWTKISGPVSFTFSNASGATNTVSNLSQGVYEFRLVVTDNNGATDADTIVVTVNPAPPPANVLPIANAGSDQSIQLPTNNANLDGSGSSDPDGNIVSYAWTKLSGPASFNFSNPNGAINAVTNLTQGTYEFRLVVTDNSGATDADTVVVTVYPAPPPANVLPIANAGSDQSIQLPINNANLDGSASSDPDGSIVAYSWTKISGPVSFTFSNASGATNTVSNLSQGVYEFRLVVTDNNGATDADTIVVTVNPAPPPVNIPPVSNAGMDHSIVLPVNSVTLNGSGSTDADGTIVSYVWTKLNGPATYSFSNANGVSNVVSNLTVGTYEFRLVVTDNNGASDDDIVLVTVAPRPNQLPISRAGNDITIMLPVNNTVLNGSASSDPDGTITAYNWTTVSGPSGSTIVNATSATPNVVGMSAGTYVFELEVTDNDGAKATDQVNVSVLVAGNQPPVARAGRDTAIAVPSSAAWLNGGGSTDTDGHIVRYGWAQIGGPATATIASGFLPVTSVNSLQPGDYLFELTVTDDDGAESRDTLRISVVNTFRYEESLTINPNPVVTSTAHVRCVSDSIGNMLIRIIDMNGNLVQQHRAVKAQSHFESDLNLVMLKPGPYYLEAIIENKVRMVRKFIKQ